MKTPRAIDHRHRVRNHADLLGGILALGGSFLVLALTFLWNHTILLIAVSWGILLLMLILWAIFRRANRQQRSKADPQGDDWKLPPGGEAR
jgi:membrane protein implicated in regulation of membrane protease activity